MLVVRPLGVIQSDSLEIYAWSYENRVNNRIVGFFVSFFFSCLFLRFLYLFLLSL